METRAAGVPLPVRAWRAVCERGPGYAWHKVLRRGLSPWPEWKRRLVYSDPRSYWTHRGGVDYFCEQEGQEARSLRAAWIAERLSRYEPESVLEVGCGYGKQLRALRSRSEARLCGVDFSVTQLAFARDYLAGVWDVSLVLAEGGRLPFRDGAFDLVFTSAVILHNPPPVAERMREEVIRVARRWAAHNEDTNVSYNRFGYDTAAWYGSKGIELVECGSIPVDGDGAPTQFCVAKL